ncbi:MAG TPA: 30S ribosomal protein S2 [archaeon]|nr:30S ribosomal protein S2 [archaeon]
MPTRLLIPRNDYLASGLHIGMKQRTADMKEFIYKIRSDGMSVLNLRKVDERIRSAAKFLGRQQKIMVVGRKYVAHEPIMKFAEVTGMEGVVGRFLPGTLTNPKFRHYYEADVVIISDPLIDYQALREAVSARVPIVGICDTFNETRNIDLVIPANNKSRKALATLFWLLAREILKLKGQIASDKEFKFSIEDFGGREEYDRFDREYDREDREDREDRHGREERYDREERF